MSDTRALSDTAEAFTARSAAWVLERWVNEWTDTSRYVARHPPGL
jgi:hypothetical protein